MHRRRCRPERDRDGRSGHTGRSSRTGRCCARVGRGSVESDRWPGRLRPPRHGTRACPRCSRARARRLPACCKGGRGIRSRTATAWAPRTTIVKNGLATSVMIRPSVCVLWCSSPARVGSERIRVRRSPPRRAVASPGYARVLVGMTRDTVIGETPAFVATSRMVVARMRYRYQGISRDVHHCIELLRIFQALTYARAHVIDTVG